MTPVEIKKNVARDAARAAYVFALVSLLAACTARTIPVPELPPSDNVSLVQVMYDAHISAEAKSAASRLGIIGRLMRAIKRELQGRKRWSTDNGARLTIRIVDFGLRHDTSLEIVVEKDGHLVKTYPVATPSTSGHGLGEGQDTRLERMIDKLANTIVEGY